MAQLDSCRPVPFIDSRIEHITVRKVRLLTRGALRELDHPILIHGENASPQAVLIPYQMYLEVQALMLQVLEPALARLGVDVETGAA